MVKKKTAEGKDKKDSVHLGFDRSYWNNRIGTINKTSLLLYQHLSLEKISAFLMGLLVP